MKSEEKNKYVRWILDHVIDLAKGNWKVAAGVVLVAGISSAGTYVAVKPAAAPPPTTMECECITQEQCLAMKADMPEKSE